MDLREKVSLEPKRWGMGKVLTVLLVLAVVVSGSLATQDWNLAPAHVQPLLLELAIQHPNQPVRVIVQQQGEGTASQRLIARTGGRVLRELPLINAYLAQLPAGAVRQVAQASDVRWISLDAPVRQADDVMVFTTWATEVVTTTTNTFVNATAMVDPVGFGPDGVYGFGARAKGRFAGFAAEVTPGHAINKVELILYAYTSRLMDREIKFQLFLGDNKIGEVKVRARIFGNAMGPEHAGPVVVDLTPIHRWRWADFDRGLAVQIEHVKFRDSEVIYYDAIGLRITSIPGDDDPGDPDRPLLPREAIDASHLANAFNAAVRAPDVWNEAPAYLQGQDVTIAIVDSGINKNKDLGRRVLKNVNFNDQYHNARDRYGHGTFVAGIAAGDGTDSHGRYMGIAPRAPLINVRVSDDQGMGTESDVVEALGWVLRNRKRYNIRVVNLSLNSAVAQSYRTSPLCAAVEILWLNGIVVVVSAGNNGNANLYPPANDPFVITVGATEDQGTTELSDDVVASFSAYGVSEVGLPKPELVAPGRDIVGYLPKNRRLTMVQNHPSHRVDDNHFRMSGTSVSAPMVSGAVALLLQDEPGLTPDQVKYRLTATANADWPGYDPARAGAGYLDIYTAVHGSTQERANRDIVPNQLLARMAVLAAWASLNGGDAIDWANLDWSTVNWDSVNWDSVNWDSVNWDSVNWDSVNWDSVNWDSVNWDSVNWDSVNWDSVNWDSLWNSVNWDSVNWDSDYWDD